MEHFLDFFIFLFEFILHVDQHLVVIMNEVGPYTYLVLFMIVFAETGLVFTPFLPGDSLLFAVGSLAALEGSVLDPWLIAITLILAAIFGDNANYWIGRKFGEKFTKGKAPWLNPQKLQKTHQFFDKYGVKTVLFARFVPIVRTFAPFVAGLGKMNYRKYFGFSVLGSVCWIGLFIPAGFHFGKFPIVQKNFSLVALGVIFLSILPILIGLIRSRIAAK